MAERVIAIDFDGTLFENQFPKIGNPIWDVINRAKKEKENGSKLILWTCRNGRSLKEAIKACEDVGLQFDCVNESLTIWVEKFNNDCRKIGATEYWDDKAINPVLNPETLPIVQELRNEISRLNKSIENLAMNLKNAYEQRDEAGKKLMQVKDERDIEIKYLKVAADETAANVRKDVQGEWVTRYRSGIEVKEGVVSTCCDMWNERRTNFCPNCGAKMKG